MIQTQTVKTNQPSSSVSADYKLRWFAWLLLPMVALVLVGCSGKQEETPPATSDTETTQPTDTAPPTTGDPSLLTEVAPSSLNTKVTTNLNLATNAARDWRADAAGGDDLEF